MSPSSMTELLNTIKPLIDQERQTGTVNSLEAFSASKARRATIGQLLASIQQEVRVLQETISTLPALPDPAQIHWAQTVLELPNLAFLEIDTTGLEEADDIIRLVLMDHHQRLIEDVLIKPAGGKLSEQASQINGLTQTLLDQEGLSLGQAWERFAHAVRGKYILSFAQKWDIQQLNKTALRYHLPPITLIGECLQQRAFAYYHNEYYLTLEKLCERIGHALPHHPAQTAIDRVQGQIHLVKAIAAAITNVRPVHQQPPEEADGMPIETDWNADLDALDEHPF